ncbi:sulfotransferase 1A1-like isoform X2 [Dreissena polymorpha]|uniref:sulfotransferase 1A1-like isoform X2 n=1 Tax=Dreissena polymorpha TaxID=45954 RepID=UPI00226535C1|nr:sulfotransferase 1A1-like isoform X2 [Dreissena polymorpha]
MSRQYFHDVPDGDTILYDVIDDKPEVPYRLAVFRLETYEEKMKLMNSLPEYNCREKDMFLFSYPKTGTNWLWEIITMITTGSPEVSGSDKGFSMLEATPASMTDQLPNPRILNSHLLPKYLPKAVFTGNHKCVFVARNPKDAVVSFYNHTKGLKIYEYTGKFENYLQMFMRGEVDYGGYPEYLRHWQRFMTEHPDVPMHVMYYEDIKENFVEEVRKLSAFIGYNLDELRLQQIRERCEMNNMKEGKLAKMGPEVLEVFKELLRDGFMMLRKGQVGDWKNWFTVAQSEQFDAWWAEQTKDITRFSFRHRQTNDHGNGMYNALTYVIQCGQFPTSVSQKTGSTQKLFLALTYTSATGSATFRTRTLFKPNKHFQSIFDWKFRIENIEQ